MFFRGLLATVLTGHPLSLRQADLAALMASLLLTPRYSPSSSPRHLNIWVLKRAMEDRQLQVEHGKRLANGDVLLKLCPDYPIPPGVLGTTEIHEVEVAITMPDHLNLIKGIIHHPELALMDQNEVLDMLSEHQVVQVRKAPQAAHALVAWARSTCTELPATVLVGWDRVRVRPCKLRPRRCYCCQQYGHVAAVCTKSPVCSQCAGEHDPEDFCDKPRKCAVCGGPHAATDPECQAWVEEKAVAKLRQEQKLSYSAALKRRQQERRAEERRPTEEERRPAEEERRLEEERKPAEEERRPTEKERRPAEDPKMEEEPQKNEDSQKRKINEDKMTTDEDSTSDEDQQDYKEDQEELDTNQEQLPWQEVSKKKRQKRRRRQQRDRSEDSPCEAVCMLKMSPFLSLYDQ